MQVSFSLGDVAAPASHSQFTCFLISSQGLIGFFWGVGAVDLAFCFLCPSVFRKCQQVTKQSTFYVLQSSL